MCYGSCLGLMNVTESAWWNDMSVCTADGKAQQTDSSSYFEVHAT